LTTEEIKQDYNQGKAFVMGALGTDSSGNPSYAASAEYCIPGDTSTCSPPVARWDFEEGTGTVVRDNVGTGNTGVISSATWTSGKIGKGLNFDGSDDYVSLGDPADGTFDPGTEDFSLELWAWISSSQVDNNYPQLVWKGGWGGTTQPGFNIYYDTSSGTLYFRTKYADLGSEISSTYNLSGNNFLDKWIHIAGTVDRDGNQRLFINGQLKDTDGVSSYSAVSLSNNTSFYIGGTGYDFTGKIDSIRFYKYLRSPAQIAWDYNRGAPVAHWKFDECQGTTANDSTGNSVSGTLSVGNSAPQTTVGTCTDGLSTSAWYNGRSGKYSASLNFDGVDDWIDMGTPTALDFSTGSDFSLSTWVKFNAYPGDFRI
jgi:hypothetical protein